MIGVTTAAEIHKPDHFDSSASSFESKDSEVEVDNSTDYDEPGQDNNEASATTYGETGVHEVKDELNIINDTATNLDLVWIMSAYEA